MGRVGCRRRVVFFGLTTTKVLIIDVGRGSSIHHGCVAVYLPRVVEDRWRREVHGLANGRVLDIVPSEHGLLTGLQLEELLIDVLPMSTDPCALCFPTLKQAKRP
jgi:hypothetical protein